MQRPERRDELRRALDRLRLEREERDRCGRRPPAGPAGAAPRLQAASVSPRMAGVRRKQTRVLGCNMADRRRMLSGVSTLTRRSRVRIRVKQQRPRRGGRGLVGSVEPDDADSGPARGRRLQRTCVTGNIPGRTPGVPASAGTAPSFPCPQAEQLVVVSTRSRRDGRARCRSRCALGLAALAPLRLVFEVLVGEEELLARRPDERVAAIHATERLVLELHRPTSHELARLLSRHPDEIAGPRRCQSDPPCCRR